MPHPHVSVILPAYNVARYLGTCLESLLAQTIGFEALEIVAVDDGSTDATGRLLDEFAAGRSNVVVLHQPNSGGAGAPRNRGIERSTGKYLFFLDPDDYLGPEALERMVATAQRNDSDVVLGRMLGVGRGAPRRPFVADVERGTLWSTQAVWSMSAQKLFRRSLVVGRGLRFLEGVRVGEDQEFVMAAYLAASTFSVVASYPCYYLVLRDDGSNATRTVPDPAALYAVVGRVLALIAGSVPPGARRNQLLARFYEVEISGKMRGHHLLSMSKRLRAAYVAQLQPLMQQQFGEQELATFPARERLRGHLLREGRLAELVALARFETAGQLEAPLVEGHRVYARLPFFRTGVAPDGCYDITEELSLDQCQEDVRWVGDRLRMTWTALSPVLQGTALDWSLQLRAQHAGLDVALPLTRSRGRIEALVDPDATAGGDPLSDGQWNPFVTVRSRDAVDGKFVGLGGTLVPLEQPASRLLKDRLALLRRDVRGRLQLELASRSARLPNALATATWDQEGRLQLFGHLGVARPAAAHGWAATVVLRCRTTGRERERAAELLDVSSSWAWRALLDLREVTDGVWDIFVRLVGERSRLEGRLRAKADMPAPTAAVHVGRPCIPYVTVSGNVSLDLRPDSDRLALAAELRQARWAGQGAQLALHALPTLRPGVEAPVSYSLVLRGAGGVEGGHVVVPVRRPPSEALDVLLDLPRLVRSSGLGAGRWVVSMQADTAGVVRAAPLRSSRDLRTGWRRWRAGIASWRAGRLIVDSDVLLEVVPVDPVVEVRRIAARRFRRVRRRWESRRAS